MSFSTVEEVVDVDTVMILTDLRLLSSLAKLYNGMPQP